MEKREPDPGGDYGYDLVHEAVASARPADPGGGADDADRSDRGGDQGGDYGYDEAHGF